MFSFLKTWLGDSAGAASSSTASSVLASDGGVCINPATGLPMTGGDCSGVDVQGNPYGADLHDDALPSASTWDDDCFSSSSDSSWD